MAPLIATTINTGQPCYGPDHDRLVFDDADGATSSDLDINNARPLADIEKDLQPLAECPVYEWRSIVDKNGEEAEDERYFQISGGNARITNLLAIQDVNGVLDVLES